MQSTDPDVRKYDRNDQWVPCPKCDGYLLPLRDYEIKSSSEDHDFNDAGGWLLWGIWSPVANFLDEWITVKARRKRLDKIKAEVLPQFPQSLVCPKCLYVAQRSGH